MAVVNNKNYPRYLKQDSGGMVCSETIQLQWRSVMGELLVVHCWVLGADGTTTWAGLGSSTPWSPYSPAEYAQYVTVGASVSTDSGGRLCVGDW